MIIRAHRFHGYNSLRHAYGRGQTVRGSLISIKYLRNPRRSTYRAAVVVSRKVHKSAVVRGRIRRRIYEIIRAQEPDITGPFDVIVTAYSEQLAVMPHAELQEMLVSQLRACGIVVKADRGGSPLEKALPHAIVDKKERT